MLPGRELERRRSKYLGFARGLGPVVGNPGVCVRLAQGPRTGRGLMANVPWSPLAVFSCAFAASAFAGLAALLRFGKRLTPLTIIASMLNSGLLGLAIMLVWYDETGQTSPYFVLGIGILAGLGGWSLLDFVLYVLRKGGLEIVIKSDNHDSHRRKR